jgi:hypothetical protein
MYGLVFPNRRPPPWLARLIRRTGLAVGAAVACGAAYYLGAVAADTVTPRPVPDPPAVVVNGLAIDPAALALGEVWETPRHVVTIPVRNVSGQARTVREFARSCSCVGVAPPTLTLQPVQTATLTVSADLTAREPHHRGLARRTATLRIQPVFEGDAAPSDGWAVTVDVRSYLSLDAPALVFGDDLVAGGPAKTRKLRLTAHVPLARVEAEADSPAVAVRVEPDGPGRYAVVVTPRPDLPVGPFRCGVAVRPVTADGVTRPAVPFEVSGAVGSPVRVSPRAVLVGEVPVPGPVVAEVVVSLPGGDGWAVARIEADAAGVDVAAAGPGPDGGTLYRITRPLDRPGSGQTEVRFVVRGPNHQTETVPVEVRWFGRPAEPKEGRP